MAGQTTLSVSDCPAGTVITLQHAEVLFANGSVRDTSCRGPGRSVRPTLESRSRPLQVLLTPHAADLHVRGLRRWARGLSHAVHLLRVPLHRHHRLPRRARTSQQAHGPLHPLRRPSQYWRVSSSSDLLNGVHHATRYASWSNLMDVPTDCPQRERRGWLGTAQLSFETVLHNVDGARSTPKWIGDLG